MQQYDGRLAVCPPKTEHSTRVIALDHTTVAALAAHRERQLAEAAAYGPGYRVSGFVFTNLNGDPMAPDRLTRIFKKLAAQAGLPRRRRRQGTRNRRRARAGGRQAGTLRRSRAHPARQLGRSRRRHRRRLG